MNSVIRAHYDGKHIIPDEVPELPVGVPLLITVVAGTFAEGRDLDREAWAATGARSLAQAYGDDEPEYSVADIKS
jgi:hypothetical protein